MVQDTTLRIQEHYSVDCFSLPKVELHAHLNGSLSISTIEKLMKLRKEQFPHEVPNDDCVFLEEPKTMAEAFKMFPVIHSLTRTFEAIRLATSEVISDFWSENTVYLELRTTPKKNEHLSKEKYIEAVLQGIRDCAHLNIVVRLLLSIDRRQSVDNAQSTVDLAKKYLKADPNSPIVGIDLSGDPSFDGRPFILLLKEARRAGLKLSVHLAEMREYLEEVNDFISLSPDRIGHGTYLHSQDDWVQRISQQKIPFEVCLTSNVLTYTVSSFAESHLTFWMNKNVPVAICTDDKGIMCTSLSKEFEIAAKTFNFSRDQLVKISIDCLEISFLNKESEEFTLLKNTISSFFNLNVA